MYFTLSEEGIGGVVMGKLNGLVGVVVGIVMHNEKRFLFSFLKRK